ncbi:Hypothetical predicted protein [Octopus vulgaris]|uniref:Uncharacterized protein n=1 Tax=Octopus vulgaris TaxID=6645 RepID=A0AA36EXA0_OCTVU|nr:Hypothetical predicted protein [Octopus vulgaris]
MRGAGGGDGNDGFGGCGGCVGGSGEDDNVDDDVLKYYFSTTIQSRSRSCDVQTSLIHRLEKQPHKIHRRKKPETKNYNTTLYYNNNNITTG